MLGLNLDDATPWQRNLLAHTHVFDRERCGTVLLFDAKGKPSKDISEVGGLFKVPIASISPQNLDSLRHKAKVFYRHAYKSRKLHPMVDEIVESVIRHATERLSSRPPDHHYTPTDEENLQILRLFSEANKYPAATAELFHDKLKSPHILAVYPDRNGSKHLLYKKSAYGFYAGRTNIIGIADFHPRECRFTVAEEIFHALDRPRFIERPRFEERDIDDLLERANHVLHSYFADKFYGSDAKPGKHDFKMGDFRERAASTFQHLPLPSHSDKDVSLLLLAEQRLLRQVANFKNQTGYNEQPEKWDRELFAKLATLLVLRRHVHRNNNAELERRTEAQLFATNAGRAVIGQLDILDDYYKQRPQAERDQAERFAEQAAKALEARQPHASRYERAARQNGGAAR